MLGVVQLETSYGQTRILRGVTFEVGRGEIVAVLGRNGAGKTTLLRSIMGLTPARSGRILFKDLEITRLPTYKIAALGISYVPQGKHIFPRLSVADNLKLGTRVQRSAQKVVPPGVFDYFPVLAERLGQMGATLSGGEQQMLALARGLVGEPELMLLDEPSESLQPNLVEAIKEIILRVCRDRGVAILLVEQNLDFARSLARQYYVMENGSIVLRGETHDLTDEEVIRQYLAV
ncbi:MAG: ABC transporter ATP-binding protein [Candidatus Rokuibacteriota bacterium]